MSAASTTASFTPTHRIGDTDSQTIHDKATDLHEDARWRLCLQPSVESCHDLVGHCFHLCDELGLLRLESLDKTLGAIDTRVMESISSILESFSASILSRNIELIQTLNCSLTASQKRRSKFLICSALFQKLLIRGIIHAQAFLADQA